MHRDEEWPPLAATRESPCTETKTQHSHKNKLKRKKIKKKMCVGFVFRISLTMYSVKENLVSSVLKALF